ncbi:MAG: hypothetical protein OXH67_14430 [Acidimicrobiaceae bacterium]|nr:hypothetical protein [Acidimicrobiaceae bacterium]
MSGAWKLTLWLIGGLVAFTVIVGIMGAATIEDEERAPSAEVAPTTTTAATTTTSTTTTTAPPATTTEAPLTVEECLEWERAESHIIYEISDSLGEMAAAMAVGDADMAHSWYWHAKGYHEVLHFDEWLIECGHWNPNGTARAAADYETAEEAWQTVERICRDALEPLGLAC